MIDNELFEDEDFKRFIIEDDRDLLYERIEKEKNMNLCLVGFYNNYYTSGYKYVFMVKDIILFFMSKTGEIFRIRKRDISGIKEVEELGLNQIYNFSLNDKEHIKKDKKCFKVEYVNDDSTDYKEHIANIKYNEKMEDDLKIRNDFDKLNETYRNINQIKKKNLKNSIKWGIILGIVMAYSVILYQTKIISLLETKFMELFNNNAEIYFLIFLGIIIALPLFFSIVALMVCIDSDHEKRDKMYKDM